MEASRMLWDRSVEDDSWSVVGYSDGSRFLYEDGLAERLTLIGEIEDGLGMSEICETSNGAIIALYSSGPQAFADREAWLDSLAEADKPAARNLLADK
jgi:hypothetical protein